MVTDDQFRKVLGTLKKPKPQPPAAQGASDVNDDTSMGPDDSEDTPFIMPTASGSRGSKRGAPSAKFGPSAKK